MIVEAFILVCNYPIYTLPGLDIFQDIYRGILITSFRQIKSLYVF